MPTSFLLIGDIKSVSKVFSEIVDAAKGVSNWTLSWPGEGAAERDAIVQVGVATDIAEVEKIARAIAKVHKVGFKPGQI